ncbi:hypothetical protein [Bacillus sp. NPDC094106]
MLIPNNVHQSWKPFLTEDRKQELEEIESEIGEDFTPSDTTLIL